MDMKLLRTFVATAKLLSFRRAGERLYLAQPTVTAHIQLLESELRAQLFDRTSRRVKLTPAGQLFLQHAEQVLLAYERGLQELTGWQQGYRERLVLVSSPLIARSTLPRVVQRFTAQYPDVEVVVHIAISQEVAPIVAEGKAHIGLSRIPSASRDLESRVWYTDPIILVMPHDGRDHDAPPPDWREVLTTNRLLTHNHPTYWDDLLLSLYSLNLPVRTMEVSLVDITKRFIEEGLGVSFLPHSTVWRELQEGRLLEVATPGLTLPTAATYVIGPTQGISGPAATFRQTLFSLIK